MDMGPLGHALPRPWLIRQKVLLQDEDLSREVRQDPSGRHAGDARPDDERTFHVAFKPS
jgi:hypothetical protein